MAAATAFESAAGDGAGTATAGTEKRRRASREAVKMVERPIMTRKQIDTTFPRFEFRGGLCVYCRADIGYTRKKTESAVCPRVKKFVQPQAFCMKCTIVSVM